MEVGVIGDWNGSAPQAAIAESLRHVDPDITTRWIPTSELTGRASEALAGCTGVWCAPGSPYNSFEGALEGIRWAREQAVPFIGTCGGFQHGVLEVARNVCGLDHAHHAEYDGGGDLIIDELLCSLVGQTMDLRLLAPDLVEWYGSEHPEEDYYCRFGLNESYRARLAGAGLEVAAIDDKDGSTRILRLATHPFFLLTLFVPQTRSAPERPHPLVAAFVRATRQSDKDE